VPQDTKDWANSEGSADLDERSGEESEEEGGRSRQEALIHQHYNPLSSSPTHYHSSSFITICHRHYNPSSTTTSWPPYATHKNRIRKN
jgi:hypothetical protein